jgi:hypothetical protein
MFLLMFRLPIKSFICLVHPNVTGTNYYNQGLVMCIVLINPSSKRSYLVYFVVKKMTAYGLIRH